MDPKQSLDRTNFSDTVQLEENICLYACLKNLGISKRERRARPMPVAT